MVLAIGPVDCGAQPARSSTCCVRSTIALGPQALLSMLPQQGSLVGHSMPCIHRVHLLANLFCYTLQTRAKTQNADTHNQVRLRIGFTENLVREQNQVVLEAHKHSLDGPETETRKQTCTPSFRSQAVPPGVNNDLSMIGELTRLFN